MVDKAVEMERGRTAVFVELVTSSKGVFVSVCVFSFVKAIQYNVSGVVTQKARENLGGFRRVIWGLGGVICFNREMSLW